MHTISKITILFLLLATLTLIISSCGAPLPQPTPTRLITATSLPAATYTETPAPTFTPTISSTPAPSATPSPRPTNTSTPQPIWVSNFAQPILDAIALRTPDFQDDFDDKSGGWQAPVGFGPRIKILDGEMILTDCQVHRPHMDYADFVVEFDARFLPETNKSSHWQFVFRLYDAPFTHIAADYYGSIFIIDLQKREHEEFSFAANPGLETNHLLVIVKGTKFAFYINNQPFYYLESPSVFRQGDIRLGNDDGSGAIDLAHPAIVAFDNFKIWNIWDISIP